MEGRQGFQGNPWKSWFGSCPGCVLRSHLTVFGNFAGNFDKNALSRRWEGSQGQKIMKNIIESLLYTLLYIPFLLAEFLPPTVYIYIYIFIIYIYIYGSFFFVLLLEK